jgi:hypothetical protein
MQIEHIGERMIVGSVETAKGTTVKVFACWGYGSDDPPGRYEDAVAYLHERLPRKLALYERLGL